MDIQLKKFNFPNEAITFISPSWDELTDITFELSTEILASKKNIDVVVTLAKGGWPMVRALLDFLGVDKVSSVGVKFYEGIDSRAEKPEIYQDFPDSTEILGKDVLLFDDVADTGKSILFIKEYLEQKGAKTVTVVSLFYKPHSLVKPDFYGAETNEWIIFPYELRETLEVLAKRWLSQGMEKEEILQRFIGLGFKEIQILYFLNMYLQKA